MQKALFRPADQERISWPEAWSQKAFRIKFISVWLLIFPLLAAFPLFFGHIEKREGVVLNDWLLNHIPVHNVSVPVFIFIWGATLIAVIRSVNNPRMLLMMLWTYLLVTAGRLFCIWLVPLNAPPHLIPLVDPLTNFFYGKQYVTKDLFYSGHTCSVCIILLCLTKKWDKILTLVFLICLAILLLIQHVHYTIDILAAPVASYVSYRLARMIIIGGD